MFSAGDESQKRWAGFWLGRTGWQPSWAARGMAEKCHPSAPVADVGGGHGRDSLWLGARGFRVVLLEPNRYSLLIALRRAKETAVPIEMARSLLPALPVRDHSFGAVNFYWGLHSYPDEDKPAALVEIKRILAPGGLLFSASFRSWSGHPVPSSIHLVPKREDFILWHEKAGFRTLSLTDMTDETYSFEKSWCGEFLA